MTLALAVIWTLLSPVSNAAAAAYSPDLDIRALREDNEAMMRAIDHLVSTAVEPEKIPALRARVDEALQHGGAAGARARGIYEGTTPPHDEMTAVVKGRGRLEPIDRRCEAIIGLHANMRKRWDRAYDVVHNLQPAAYDGEDNAQRAQSRIRRDAWGDAGHHLEDANRHLKECQPYTAEMDEYRQTVLSKTRRARQAREELARAVDTLSKSAEALGAAGREARARIDLVATEPQTENRGRAGQKIRELVDAARAVYYDADVAKHRSEDFGDNYRGYAGAYARFEERESAAERRLRDAEKPLKDAEDLLPRFR
ncbi:MAG: hypothetical protein HY078_07155 [Elusimicrobia bacterium]|nr:hypothetical protein [Elusimicrobiota bacterium]